MICQGKRIVKGNAGKRKGGTASGERRNCLIGKKKYPMVRLNRERAGGLNGKSQGLEKGGGESHRDKGGGGEGK